jgi:hypothetical protein
MITCPLAEVRTSQEKTNVNLKEIRAGQEHLKEEMRAGQEPLKEEMLAKLDAHHKRMMARMDSWLEKMEACLGKTEVTDLETNPVEIESEVEQQEVLKEAAVKTVRALMKQHGDRQLAIGCRQKLKKLTQGNGRSQEKLAAAWRGLIAMPSLHGVKDQQLNRDDEKIGPGRMLQEKPQKDGCSGRDIRHN